MGDFNAWRTGATRIERDTRSGEWEAQIAMVPGRHRYAFVVDDTQWVADPAAPAALAPNGRTASRFVVPNQDGRIAISQPFGIYSATQVAIVSFGFEFAPRRPK